MIYEYDMLGSQVSQNSVDAGRRWMLNNVVGNPLRRWDGRKQEFRYLYDELQRPTQLMVQQQQPNPREFLAEHTVYGESHQDSQERNLRGQVYKQYDGSGLVTFEQYVLNPQAPVEQRVSLEPYDFKSNAVTSSRRMAKEYRDIVDWSDLLSVNDPTIVENRVLEQEAFYNLTRYDALNRPIQVITPHNSQVRPNVLQPTFNEANLLETMDVWIRQPQAPAGLLDSTTADQHTITGMEYNAKGQRKKIAYGNGVQTTYSYDPFTFRLSTMESIRPIGKNPLQAYRYTYDPVGNIDAVRDGAESDYFFQNCAVHPHTSYRYDALYRLIEAKGREHIGQTGSHIPVTVRSSSHTTTLMIQPGVICLFLPMIVRCGNTQRPFNMMMSGISCFGSSLSQ